MNLDRETGALVDGTAVETLYLSDNVPVLEGAINVNGIEVSACMVHATSGTPARGSWTPVCEALI